MGPATYALILQLQNF